MEDLTSNEMNNVVGGYQGRMCANEQGGNIKYGTNIGSWNQCGSWCCGTMKMDKYQFGTRHRTPSFCN